MSDGEHGWELAMPFVSVRDRGGPYDAESYVAGFEAARIGTMLAQGADQPALSATIHAGNRDQVDLIAMGCGWRAAFGPGENGWMTVEFTRTWDGVPRGTT